VNNCSGNSGFFSNKHASITYEQAYCPLCIALAELHRVKTIVWDFAKGEYERAESNRERASDLEVELLALKRKHAGHCGVYVCTAPGPRKANGRCCDCNCPSCVEADEV